MLRRVIPTVAVVALTAGALAGCSAADPRLTCETPIQPGALTDSVTATTGEQGVTGVRITGPDALMNAQRTVIASAGSNDLVRGDDVVTARVSTFDARGRALAEPQTRFLQAMPDDVMPDLVEFLQSSDADQLRNTDIAMAAIRCSAPGDALAVAITGGQARSSQLGDEPVVMVVEVLAAQPLAASGAARALPSGFPAVTTDETGRPGIVLPPHRAPDDLKVATRIEGDGADVEAGDYMIGNVLTVGWDGTERSNTWSTGIAELGTAQQPGQGFSFRPALTGQHVGSQVVVLDPNNGDPVVRVVDIIAVG